MQNKLTKLMGVEYPIIQAPMAGGVTTTNLVSSVSKFGGLGMIGAGYMTPEQMRNQIKEIKRETTKPFGINIFIPNDFKVLENEINRATELLQPLKEQLHVKKENSALPTVEREWETFYEQLKVIIDEKVPICSFTFGLPPKETITNLKDHGIFLIGTATTAAEALLCQEIGMDAVVLQGSEAGGHRGTFAGDDDHPICIIPLISLVRAQVSIPIIAAGGIMNGRGVYDVLSLGAQAAQLGTAFLTCLESGAHKAHKQAIFNLTDNQTVLTRVYSGKWARGINNKFYQELKAFEEELPPFPLQNALTNPIRKASAQQSNPDYMSLWAGQNAFLAKNQSVKDLMEALITELTEIKKAVY
ncbi:NAD(P)H-dependent flavin oxidoreductase [Neobacillus sp. K501]